MTSTAMELSFMMAIKNIYGDSVKFSVYDVERLLNLANIEYIDYWYSKFEADEGARKRLAQLVVTDNTLAVNVTYTKYGNGYEITYPTAVGVNYPLKYALLETAVIKYMTVVGQITYTTFHDVWIKPINLDYFNLHSKNTFKKPYNSMIWRMEPEKGKHILILPTGAILDKYTITYLKVPQRIQIFSATAYTSEVTDSFHEEVVDWAVKLAVKEISLLKQTN